MTVKADYRDQTGIFDPSDFTWPIHVIGLGGIGSALLPPLFKLGFNGDLHIWDEDAVEPHNIPAQLLYRGSDVGLKKADAVIGFAERQEAECSITPHYEFVTPETGLDGIVISGVDSMVSRKAIWEAVSANNYLIPLYMDGRIGGEQLQLLTVNPSDYDAGSAYEAWLFTDEQGAQLPCAERTVIHPPTILAGLMISALTLFAREITPKANIMMHAKNVDLVS